MSSDKESGETEQSENDTERPSLTCSNGHKHAVEDMDVVGMDYGCPECGEVIRPHE